MVTYSESGVDISLEEVTVSALISKLKETLNYREVITESGHFAALVKLGDRAIAMSTDGVGSKILVAEMMEKYDTVGIDCIAMVVNDIICVGAEPIAMVDYLAVEKPDPKIAEQIGEGLKIGCQLAKVAMIGGETASLPEIVSNFDLAGTGIGIVDVKNIITGKDISDGDVLIGIESSGIHSNGLSLARKIFFEENNFKVSDQLPNHPETIIGNELLKPTNIYVNPIVELLKTDVEVHGLAHITGGGFNNLKRLKKGIGYDITSLPEPQAIFKEMHSLGVPIKELYRVFNMGIGFVVIVRPEDENKTLEVLGKYNLSYNIGHAKIDQEDNVTINTFKEGTIIL